MKPYYKIPLIYLLISGLWILGSDQVVQQITDTPEYMTEIQTFKGWFFVLVSTFLIFCLTRGAFIREQKDARAKRDLFTGTMRGSYHIILNYLNQMQLIHLEAQRSTDFDKDLLTTAERISEGVVDELRNLEKLDIADASDIERFLQQQMRQENHAD